MFSQDWYGTNETNQQNLTQQPLLPSPPNYPPPPLPPPPREQAPTNHLNQPLATTYPPDIQQIPSNAEQPPVVRARYNPETQSFQVLSDSQENIEQILKQISYHIERRLIRYPIPSYRTITPNIIDITPIEYRQQPHEKNHGLVYFIKALVSLEGAKNPQYIHLRVAKKSSQPAVIERMLPLMREEDALGYLASDMDS